jgi:uncharacterized membrane protein (UPF0182 family)
VAYLTDDTVRVAPSLAQLAGTLPVAPPPTSTPGANEIRARAAAVYARMREALRRGDWAAFGQAFDELGKLLGGSR